MTDKKCQKVPQNYSCISCDYFTSHLSHWKKHLMTKKHQRLTNTDASTDKKCQKVPLVCECGKTYKHRQSLFAHKKKCSYNYEEDDCSIISTDNTIGGLDKDELILKLVTQQGELIDALKKS